MRVSPRVLRFALNLWPPFLGAGIRVRAISPDWRYVRVELRHGLANTGAFGTHFGGSLYSMTDPFPALQLVQLLGPDYLVWDRAARIEYLKPGRGRVHVETRVPPEEVDRLRAAAAGGDKVLPEYEVNVIDAQGEVVARVFRTVYVRLRRSRRPEAVAPTSGDTR